MIICRLSDKEMVIYCQTRGENGATIFKSAIWIRNDLESRCVLDARIKIRFLNRGLGEIDTGDLNTVDLEVPALYPTCPGKIKN